MEETGRQIVFIIVEWDAMIREVKDDHNAQEAYLNLLRGWFKNINFTPKVVAAAYMTGILPIKKDGSQSALSAFDESSMLDPLEFAEYPGFTEDEVRKLCRSGKADFEEIMINPLLENDEMKLLLPDDIIQKLIIARGKTGGEG